jgi:acetyl esterase/lipase
MRPSFFLASGVVFCGLALWCIVGTNVLAADATKSPDKTVPDEEIVVLRELRYREGAVKAWSLDLAMRKDYTGEPRSAIVLIHGGGWLEGDKSSFSTLTNRAPANIVDFAKLGFVAVTINYRMSKEAPFPAALQDCQCAVRWLRANAEKYKIAPERIGAWGNSAGGHLALMLGMVKKGDVPEEGPYQEHSSAVQAVASDSGPIDLAYQHEHQQIQSVIEMFLAGPPTGPRLATYQLASPSHHISASMPPLLLIYGEADSQVGIETADRFVLALNQASLKDVSYYRLGKVDHCPHSLIQVPWLVPAVNAFFVRTLEAK